MNVILVICGVMLSAAGLGAVYRMIKGPSILERVLAADVLIAVIGGGLAVDMSVHRNVDNLTLLVVLSLIGFLGSVTVARYVTDRSPR